MRRFTWVLIAILVGLAGVFWYARPRTPSFVMPDAQYLTSDRAVGCTQPFYPEVYVHDYNMPDGSMIRVYGLLTPVTDATRPPEHLPGIIWMVWPKGVARTPETVSIWIMRPGERPFKVKSVEELKAVEGENVCVLLKYLPKQVM